MREIVALFLAASCTPSISPDTVAACDAAQIRLETLGCAEATTPAGTPFTRFCQESAADRRDMAPECIATIESCDEVEPARRREVCR